MLISIEHILLTCDPILVRPNILLKVFERAFQAYHDHSYPSPGAEVITT